MPSIVVHYATEVDDENIEEILLHSPLLIKWSVTIFCRAGLIPADIHVENIFPLWMLMLWHFTFGFMLTDSNLKSSVRIVSSFISHSCKSIIG